MSEDLKNFSGSLQIYVNQKWERVGEITLDEQKAGVSEKTGKPRPVLRGRVIVDNKVYRCSLWLNQ